MTTSLCVAPSADTFSWDAYVAVRRSSGAEQGEVPACTRGVGAGLWTACTTLTSIAQEEVCLEGLSGTRHRRARPCEG